MLSVSLIQKVSLFQRADVFRDLERFEEAVADLDRVVALAPDDAAAKAQLAEVRTAMAVPVSARNAFKAARAKYNADKWQVRLKKPFLCRKIEYLH